MKDLFFSELRRFRLYILVSAGVHLLLLLFIHRQSNLLQQPYFESLLLLAFYMLIGLALALMQIGSYRKPSQWLWLIHRPIAPRQIFAALALSAFAMLVFVLLLPLMLLLLSTDLFTTRVVDTRHYLSIVHLLAFAMMAWLAGCHALISRHKLAIAVLAVPMVLVLHLVSVWWLFAPVAIGLAWLTYISMQGFRANREAPIEGHVNLVLTALPLQLGLFLVLFSVGKMSFITLSIMLGTDPLNTEFPPQGGLIEIERAEPKTEFLLGLKHSRDARTATWQEQLPLMEPVRIGPYIQRFPLRHQLSNLNAPTQWFDQKRNILWTFSHDTMLFHGREPQSGAERGWWGLKGAGSVEPFNEVPFASDDGFMLTRSVLYLVDQDEQRLHERFRLSTDESFTGMPQKEFNRVFVLTNKRLLVYRTDRQAVSEFAAPILDWELTLPRGAAHLQGATIAELMDGWLISFLYGDGHRQIGFSQFSVAAEPSQHIFYVDDSGQASEVVQRSVHRDFSPLQQVAWWFSPLLHTLTEWPESALDKGLTWPLELTFLPDAKIFYLVALPLLLLSLVLALVWLRGTHLSRTRRNVWLISCALLGIPALLSLICLEPRRKMP